MNNHKVGIITFHNTTNFGSFLQTLGLYQAVVNLGYDCKVIDYRCKTIESAELPASTPPKYTVKELVKFILFEPLKRKKYDAIKKAIKGNITLTCPYTLENIKEANKDIDVFITGSDILWDLNLTGNDTTYFLDFTDEEKKRIAFSTSIGNQWTNDKYEMIQHFLKRYDRIALREEPSATWLSARLGKKIDSVCDPTMLMDVFFWNDFIEKSNLSRSIHKEYILIYFPSDKIVHDAKKYASENNFEIVVINYGLKIKGVKNVSPFMVEDFLLLIKNAKLVLTSSYHGTLFAIYFNVPFYSYLRDNAHNIRFKSLLDKLHIENRLRNDYSESELSMNVDWRLLQDEVKKWRKESLKLLTEYLE